MKLEDPIVFHVPTPFSFEITKSVPWNHNAITYVAEKPLALEPVVTNIDGIGGITLSGRVFTPEQPPNNNTPKSSKEKKL